MGVSTKITLIRIYGGYAMTGNKCKGNRINLQEIFGADKDGLKELFREVLQEVLEQEMTDAIGAEKGERSPGRLGYRSGYYGRSLVTRVGKLELRIPQDRQGQFSTQIFERYQRSEKALVSALAEMYIQGVSTRKVKAITEELCGHAFSASAISAVNKTMDESLERFAKRPLEEAYPYLVLDARYERVWQDGVIRSRAVQIAIGINEEGRRQILALELANRESQTSWKEVLLELKSRGLRGVEFVVSDDHPGLKRAIAEGIPEALWQRCSVLFLRNARDHLPRKAQADCPQELRWLYDRERFGRSPERPGAMARALGAQISAALRVGGREQRRDSDLLPVAAAAPQAPEVHQPAGAVQ